MIRFCLACLAVLAAGSALAQHVQPYAGLTGRPIKALSEQQIADLRAGRGMGLALAAELNGFPGPLHVIELRHELGLTDAQLARAQELFDRMKAEAIPLGEDLIAQEYALDRAFAERRITPAGLEDGTARVGAAQARLRAAHLRFHLAMLDALTSEQAHRYAELRGYNKAQPDHLAPTHHKRHHQ